MQRSHQRQPHFSRPTAKCTLTSQVAYHLRRRSYFPAFGDDLFKDEDCPPSPSAPPPGRLRRPACQPGCPATVRFLLQGFLFHDSPLGQALGQASVADYDQQLEPGKLPSQRTRDWRTPSMAAVSWPGGDRSRVLRRAGSLSRSLLRWPACGPAAARAFLGMDHCHAGQVGVWCADAYAGSLERGRLSTAL